MKKILLILVAILSFSAANLNAQNLLSEGIKEYRKSCPMRIDDDMILNDVFISGQNVVMQFKLRDNDGIIPAVNQYPQIKQQLSDMLLGTMLEDEDSVLLLALIADNGKNLVCQLVDSRNANTKTNITVTNSAIKQAIY